MKAVTPAFPGRWKWFILWCSQTCIWAVKTEKVVSKELSFWNGGKGKQCAQHNLCRNIRAAAETAPEDKSETGRQWERKYIHVFKRILKRWPEFRGYIYFTNNKASSETINAFPHVPFLTPIFSSLILSPAIFPQIDVQASAFKNL